MPEFGIDPGWVLVNYDVSPNRSRTNLRRRLLQAGFQMMSESVYIGEFSEGLMAVCDRIAEWGRQYTNYILYWTRAIPTPEQERVWRERYEQAWMEDLNKIVTTLDILAKIMEGKHEKVIKRGNPPETEPYTKDEILGMSRRAIEHLADVRKGVEARLVGVRAQGGNNAEAEKKLGDYLKAIADMEARCNRMHDDILTGKFVITKRMKEREEEERKEKERKEEAKKKKEKK